MQYNFNEPFGCDRIPTAMYYLLVLFSPSLPPDVYLSLHLMGVTWFLGIPAFQMACVPTLGFPLVFAFSFFSPEVPYIYLYMQRLYIYLKIKASCVECATTQLSVWQLVSKYYAHAEQKRSDQNGHRRRWETPPRASMPGAVLDQQGSLLQELTEGLKAMDARFSQLISLPTTPSPEPPPLPAGPPPTLHIPREPRIPHPERYGWDGRLSVIHNMGAIWLRRELLSGSRRVAGSIPP